VKELKPPTRLVGFMCYMIGAGVVAPGLWQQFGKPGLVAGLLLGLLLGRLLGRWVRRTFLEF
jgi:hypothetical protein